MGAGVLAASGRPALEGAGIVVFAGGLVLLLTWGAMLARGRDPLHRGPGPTVPVHPLEILAAVFLSALAGFLLAGAAVRAGVRSPGLLLCFDALGKGAVAVGAWRLLLARRREHGPRLAGAVLGLLAWLATFPVIASVLLGWTALLEAAGRPWAEQQVLTSLRRDPLPFLVVAVVLAPLAEEVIYRGVLYGGLRGVLGRGGALAVSSAVFAAIHPDLSVTAPILALGAVLAFVYERTGTLAAPIALHVAFNGWTFLGTQFGGG